MKSYARPLAILLGVTMLSGCNWFDSDSVDLEPSAEIAYPTRTGFTPAGTLKVRGTSSDDRGVASVSVNGVLATSTDDFATWSAEVSLDVGSNVLRVDVVDNAGQRVAAADEVVIERRTQIARPFGYEVDAANNMLYFVDIDLNKIMTTDLGSGEVREFADISQFEPVNANGFPPLDIALDLGNNRIFMTVRDAAAAGAATIGIWSYNTVTEAWTPFSDSTIFQGSVFLNPSDVMLDAANNRLLVIDYTVDALVAVNLTNGAQTVISSNTVPNTAVALFDQPIDATLDSTNNRLLMVDRASAAIFAIDLATGSRSLISGAGTGGGPGFTEALAIAYDQPSNRAFVFNRRGNSGVIAVDLATGERSMFAPSFAGTEGLWMYDVRALAVAGGELIAFDNIYDHVLGVDLTSGARRIITNNGFPRGEAPPAFSSVRSVNGEFYGHVFTAIGKVSADNSVEILAGDPLGGTNRLDMNDAIVTADGAAAYAIGAEFVNNQFEYRVQHVDLATGTATVLSDNVTPDAMNPLSSGRGLTLNEDESELYVLETDRIMRIDTTTGARTPLPVDTSIAFSIPQRVVLDADRERLLVADFRKEFLVAVDLETGARTPFADSLVTGEARLYGPLDVTIASDGTMWMLDNAERLIRIDPLTGEKTMLMDARALDSSYPAYWSEVFEHAGLIYVKSYYGILEVDPTTGELLVVYATPESSSGNSS